MKKTLLLSTALVAALPVGAYAFDVELNGQVNKALMVFDDGNSTETTIVDNNGSTTKFALSGEQVLDSGLTASVLLSAELNGGNNSAGVTQNNAVGEASTPVATTSSFQEEFARVGIAGEWGALLLGRQDTAVDDVFYRDLGAASDVLNPGFAAFGGGLVFKDSAGADVVVGATNAQVGNLAFGFNGDIELQNSIRYNTPEWNGFNGSLSTSQGGDIDATVRYAKAYDGFEVDSAFGIGFENSGATGSTADQTYYAAFAARHESGFAGSVSYFQQELDGAAVGIDEPQGLYLKASYDWDKYGVAVDYAQFEDTLGEAVDHELTSYGIAGQMDMGNGVSVGALFRNYELDATGLSAEDIQVFALNMNVQF